VNIGIKLLTSGFLDIFARMPVSRGRKCPFPPLRTPMAPHYEKRSSTNVGKLYVAKKWHYGWLHINDVRIVAKSDFAPPKFCAGCGPVCRHERSEWVRASKLTLSPGAGNPRYASYQPLLRNGGIFCFIVGVWSCTLHLFTQWSANPRNK